MITTCDMRHLYNAKPKNETLILQAKEYERRRCNHQDLEEPLSSLECLSSVVDPKDSGTNKHRYVIASNDSSVRAKMRQIAGVPVIYISRSVVLMEPMADVTEQFREREEKSKFKLGLKGQRNPGNADAPPKRKRADEGQDAEGNQSISDQATGEARPKAKKHKGPKGPNPLSVKKPKKDKTSAPKKARPSTSETAGGDDHRGNRDDSAPKKRRRKHKSKAEGGNDDDAPGGEEPASP